MRTQKYLAFSFLLILTAACTNGHREGKHLFILSGQSNMWGLRHDLYFTPVIEEHYSKENIIVVKDAQGNEPIYKWYKLWKNSDGKIPEHSGELYDRLMAKVNAAIAGQSIQTITFIWMQGETDARLGYGDVYADSLKGLYRQLQMDMGRKDINFVIGRINDFDLDNHVFPDWTKVREAQESVAASNKRFALVNTDDLNDGVNRPRRRSMNDLHCSPTGFAFLGMRFAESAARLIDQYTH